MDPARGGGTKKKVGGLTLPLNDCTEAGVQGLHSEEFFSPLASEKVVGLSPPTPQSGGAKAPSAPPAPPPLDPAIHLRNVMGAQLNGRAFKYTLYNNYIILITWLSCTQ